MYQSIQSYSSQPALLLTTCNPAQTFLYMPALVQVTLKALEKGFVDLSVNLEQASTRGLKAVVKVNDTLVQNLNALELFSILKVEGYREAAAVVVTGYSVQADGNGTVPLGTNINAVSLLVQDKGSEDKIRDFCL